MADTYTNRDAAMQAALLGEPLLNDPPLAAEPSIAQLVSTLINDAQVLVQKEFSLARHEIQQEIEKSRQAAIILGIGSAIIVMGGMLLLIALVQGLVVWFSLPLWISYLIVGIAFAIVGGILVAMGRARIEEVHPLPEQAIDSVRKDISWLKEQKPSDKI